ncbi:MAG: hypothetical protein FJY82_05545 [Candidatus Aminicenantes bacterium]|nr:hypothetical protein [Candidatus Aminicenantes bacterium]
MNKAIKYLVFFLIFDAVVIGAYFGYRALRGGGGPGLAGVPWVTVDEDFEPRNEVEAFIKADAENRGALPVQIRNFGSDKKALKRFKGRELARPTENILNLFFKGLADWMIVEIKIKTGGEIEAVRTVLYVLQNTQWKVGDSGSLLD